MVSLPIPKNALSEDFECGDDVRGLFPYQPTEKKIKQAGWVYSRYSYPSNQDKRVLVLVDSKSDWRSQKVVAWDGTSGAIKMVRGYVHELFDYNPFVVNKGVTCLQRKFRDRH